MNRVPVKGICKCCGEQDEVILLADVWLCRGCLLAGLKCFWPWTGTCAQRGRHERR